MNWKNPSNLNSSQPYEKINLSADGNLFSGLTSFTHRDKNYFLFSLPKVHYCKSGALFLADETFSHFYQIYEFDPTNTELFAYGYSLVTNQTKNKVNLLVVYEWSAKTKIFNYDDHHNDCPKGEGIHLDNFEINLK